MIKWVSGRAFAEFVYWECWLNGMYRTEHDQSWPALAAKLLSGEDVFWRACCNVIEKWPVSTAIHLSNSTINRRAWLGQAACCLTHNIPEESTRMGWWLLASEQQDHANRIASGVIEKWNEENCQTQRDRSGLLF